MLEGDVPIHFGSRIIFSTVSSVNCAVADRVINRKRKPVSVRIGFVFFDDKIGYIALEVCTFTRMTIRKIRPEDNAAVASIIRTVMPEFGASGQGFAIHDRERSEEHTSELQSREK